MTDTPLVADFRALCNEIWSYSGGIIFDDILAHWVGRSRAAVAALGELREARPYDTAILEHSANMWNLYALSRVNDILLLAFQNVEDGRETFAIPAWFELSREQYVEFFESLGFVLMERADFSAFYHEILNVRQAPDENQPVALGSEHWPCLMLGNMMFSRAGVDVVAGAHLVNKEIAETSALYFCYTRRGRRTADLSKGWGSNSQWRTSFRRDFHVGPELIYNIDGKYLLNAVNPDEVNQWGLSVEERTQLCKYRCSIVKNKRDDVWPYDDQLSEKL